VLDGRCTGLRYGDREADDVVLDGKRSGDDWLSDGYTNGEPRHDDSLPGGAGVMATTAGAGRLVTPAPEADRYDVGTPVPAMAGAYLASATAWPTGAWAPTNTFLFFTIL